MIQFIFRFGSRLIYIYINIKIFVWHSEVVFVGLWYITTRRHRHHHSPSLLMLSHCHRIVRSHVFQAILKNTLNERLWGNKRPLKPQTGNFLLHIHSIHANRDSLLNRQKNKHKQKRIIFRLQQSIGWYFLWHLLLILDIVIVLTAHLLMLFI